MSLTDELRLQHRAILEVAGRIVAFLEPKILAISIEEASRVLSELAESAHLSGGSYPLPAC